MPKSIFSQRLSRLLDSRNIKQNELAEAAKTTEATISRYLAGERAPHADILVEISKFLNVSTDYLLGVTDIPDASKEISPEERILLSAYNKADERDVSIIWNVLSVYLSPKEKDYVMHSAQAEQNA